MKNKPLRIIIMIISFLLGFVSFGFYLVGQVVYVVNLDSMEGYFNAWGMTFVILTLIIVLTNIHSLVFHIKILMYSRDQDSYELLDDSLPARTNINWLRKMPSKFLRNCNMLFVTTFLVNGLLNLFHGIFVMKQEDVTSLLLILCLITIVCGFILLLDAFKLKNGAIMTKQLFQV